MSTKVKNKIVNLVLVFIAFVSFACTNVKLDKANSNSLGSGSGGSGSGSSDSGGNGSGTTTNPPPLDSLVAIEMAPYSGASYNPTTGDIIPAGPAHEQFILFLEQQGVVLSNSEKTLIRSDSPQVQILFKYLFQGRLTGAVPNVNFNGVLDSATFELGVLFKDVSNSVVRSVRVTSDQFPSRTDMRMQYTYDVNASGNPDPQGRTGFSAGPSFLKVSDRNYLAVGIGGSFRTGTKENLSHTVNLFYVNYLTSPPITLTILRNKNFKQQSLCGFVQGSFLNSICSI